MPRQRTTTARRLTATALGLATAVGLLLPATAHAAPAPSAAAPHAGTVDVCGTAAPGFARCLAKVRTDVHGGHGLRGRAAGNDSAPPDGLGPADLRAAYQLPTTGGQGQTVAVVDAGSYPSAEADLAVYRTTYGLPACTTANGCFHQVNQTGQNAPLPPDYGWGIEIALDLDMVSAACPACHILLVDGDSNADTDLAASVDTAVALGATEVSNSYGGDESGFSSALAADYAHPGVAILASSGDYGYTIPSAPAVYPSVIAAGGTSLTRDPSTARGWTETAWSGAGSGCSAWFDKPAWQSDPNCPGRMTSDVSADADPRTGPSVYVTDPYGGGGLGSPAGDSGGSGWTVVGGTSAASPFVAGIIGLAGNPGQYPDASAFYTHTAGLNDIVAGSNGPDCGGDYQCDALPGYDGPTGLGTPKGITAF